MDQQHGLLGDYNFSGIKVSGRLSSCVVDVVDRGGSSLREMFKLEGKLL